MYMLSLIMGSIVPYSITYKVIHSVTKYISFAFTNLPGPMKPVYFNGKASKKAWIYFIPVGGCGVAISLYSHNGIIKLSTCSDEVMFKKPAEFIEMFEDTLDQVLSKVN